MPPRRCRTGASRWRSGPTSTSTSIPIARRPRTTKRSARTRFRRPRRPNERAYVDAIVKRYSNDPKADLKALAVDYKDAMHGLTVQYPDDLDALTLYAESLMDLHPWQLWATDGTPTEGTTDIVAALESVLRRDAMHIGANHYYIHAVEASRSPDRALESAHRLDTLVPAAGHLVHMPAHIYMRTGDYDSAVTSNAKAAEVDREYIKATKAEGVYPMMYYNHNLDFLASAAMMSGQFKEAKRAADMVVANVDADAGADADARAVRREDAVRAPPLRAVGRRDEAAGWRCEAPVAEHAIALRPRCGASGARQRGGRGTRTRRPTPRRERRFRPTADWGYNKAKDVLAVTDAVLDAWVARVNRDDAGAIEAWKRAVAAEDALSYDEPPDWFYPTRESLGAALLRASRFAEAEQVFRDDLARNPKNGRSLFGLARALRAQKKDATAVERQFRAAWKHADVSLRLEDF